MIIARNYLDVYPYDKWNAKVRAHAKMLFTIYLSFSVVVKAILMLMVVQIIVIILVMF